MKKVLVIDSNQCIRDLLKEELGSQGYIVHGASDGPSAMKMVVAFKPDLVILDLHLNREPDGTSYST